MNIPITELSSGGGCGCKIPESDLRRLLGVLSPENQEWLHEDVGRFGLETPYLCSIDFLQPIVEDEEQFGRIAALHAFSDIYAKGCKPEFALVILCWPRELIGIDGATKVLDGCQKACFEAGVKIIGGHSIDAQNPIFGLSVFGKEPNRHMMSVDTAAKGDYIMLTKPLGVGITSNAIRRKIVSPEERLAFDTVVNKNNSIGVQIANSKLASAMTDVTGFGLIGQLDKMAIQSRLKFDIFYEELPRLLNVKAFFDEGLETKLGIENAYHYQHFASEMSQENFKLVCDPQTNGGLLFSCADNAVDDVLELMSVNGESCWKIGRFF